MSTPPSNDETSSCSSSEAESPACATSSSKVDLEKDAFIRSDTSSGARTDSDISTNEESQMRSASALGGDDTISEGSSLPTPISSNDEHQENQGNEISQDQEEDIDIPQDHRDRDVEAGSYTISIASVAGGDKVCNVNPPRFSLMVAVAFVLGTFLLAFWLTENDA